MAAAPVAAPFKTTMSQDPTTHIVPTGYGRIFRHPNNLIYIYMADDVSLTIEAARQLVLDVRRLDNSGQARLLIIEGVRNDLNFEAQRYLATVRGVTHLGLVVRSRLQADVAQFFIALLRVFRSPYEMRVFHLLHQAEAWLLAADA